MERKEIEAKIKLKPVCIIKDMICYNLVDYRGIKINNVSHCFDEVTYMSLSDFGILLMKNGSPLPISIESIVSLEMIE